MANKLFAVLLVLLLCSIQSITCSAYNLRAAVANPIISASQFSSGSSKLKALSTRSKSSNNYNNKFVVSANTKNYNDDEIPEAMRRDKAQKTSNEKGNESSTLKSPSKILKSISQAVDAVLPPFYSVQAPLQANVLNMFDYDKVAVKKEIEEETKDGVVIYTYKLSPFCTEAIALLDSMDATYKTIELGSEWFLLGAEESAKRAVMGEMTGQTSLPQIFINGKSIGGLYSGTPGLSSLYEDNKLKEVLAAAGAIDAVDEATVEIKEE